MSIFTDSIWIWLFLALVVAAVGGSLYMNSRKLPTLGITAGVVFAILAAGYLVINYVETDYKSVSRMLKNLTAAIEKNDIEAVKKFISPQATSTIIKAEFNMKFVNITSAKFYDLEVKSNNHTAPPTAIITFTGVVHYKTKSGGDFNGVSGVARVFFEVELEKTNDSWLVTDKCKFTPTAADM
ncbi:MAG: hypothetical protein ACRC2T_07365 [Thermoguttaceae bacterium]